MVVVEALYIESSKSPKQMLELFMDGLGVQEEVEQRMVGSILFYSMRSRDFIADSREDVATRKRESYAAYMVRSIGFKPTTRMTFTLERSQDYTPVRNNLIQATLHLVKTLDCNLALNFDYGGIILVNLNNELTVRLKADIWSPERLALIDRPYKVFQG